MSEKEGNRITQGSLIKLASNLKIVSCHQIVEGSYFIKTGDIFEQITEEYYQECRDRLLKNCK